ncbi:MAG: hypothetical protein QOF60_790 [Actinomycetota bacterium]|jgi:hypothetical protein|nr:hypothetical protein [Actinomycetota bacterium]
MSETHRPISRDAIERARGWTCQQFAVSDSEADVPRLLRKVADAIEELGDIDILDVTFCLEVEGPETEAKMAVYFSFSDVDEQSE